MYNEIIDKIKYFDTDDKSIKNNLEIVTELLKRLSTHSSRIFNDKLVSNELICNINPDLNQNFKNNKQMA